MVVKTELCAFSETRCVPSQCPLSPSSFHACTFEALMLSIFLLFMQDLPWPWCPLHLQDRSDRDLGR
jgi:hypothetical protein